MVALTHMRPMKTIVICAPLAAGALERGGAGIRLQ